LTGRATARQAMSVLSSGEGITADGTTILWNIVALYVILHIVRAFVILLFAPILRTSFYGTFRLTWCDLMCARALRFPSNSGSAAAGKSWPSRGSEGSGVWSGSPLRWKSHRFKGSATRCAPVCHRPTDRRVALTTRVESELHPRGGAALHRGSGGADSCAQRDFHHIVLQFRRSVPIVGALARGGFLRRLPQLQGHDVFVR
jgi:hypothetical protein